MYPERGFLPAQAMRPAGPRAIVSPTSTCSERDRLVLSCGSTASVLAGVLFSAVTKALFIPERGRCSGSLQFRLAHGWHRPCRACGGVSRCIGKVGLGTPAAAAPVRRSLDSPGGALSEAATACSDPVASELPRLRPGLLFMSTTDVGRGFWATRNPIRASDLAHVSPCRARAFTS